MTSPTMTEEMNYKYYLPDYGGKAGVEARFDDALRGKAGVKSLVVNNRWLSAARRNVERDRIGQESCT